MKRLPKRRVRDPAKMRAHSHRENQAQKRHRRMKKGNYWGDW